MDDTFTNRTHGFVHHKQGRGKGGSVVNYALYLPRMLCRGVEMHSKVARDMPRRIGDTIEATPFSRGSMYYRCSLSSALFPVL